MLHCEIPAPSEKLKNMAKATNNKKVEDFLNGKSNHTIALFHHFVNEYAKIAPVTLYPSKTMIGIVYESKKIAWITQFGKNFIHIVFPFDKGYPDNLCFQKIAQVPGDALQSNHHFRMLYVEDINTEVIQFMKIALNNK